MVGGVCGGGVVGGACMARGVHGGGVWQVGHEWKQGGVCGRRDGHCRGLCASYWNAFLFSMRTVSLASSQSSRRVDAALGVNRPLLYSSSLLLLYCS